jgi:hypothetical protein
MSENKKKLKVPSELFHPFFFSETEVSLDCTEPASGIGKNFYYELLFYNGMKAKMPWTSPEQFLPLIQEEWGKLKPSIEDMHRQRKKHGINEAMKQGMALFLQFLFWSNGRPLCLKELPNFIELKIMPVNLEERAGFIMARPSLFHSYAQLCELMIEQEKQFAKYNMMKKASKP